MTRSACSIEGCGRVSYARTWCHMHWMRWHRHGDPSISHTMKGVPADERFARSYRVLENGCWEWTGTLRGYGYGGFRVDGTTWRAHRWAYERFVGPIPEGLSLDHVCHTLDASCTEGESCPHRRCVNPAHLEPVTHAENMRRGRAGDRNRKKTHCAQGHEFTVENTFWSRDGRKRSCRECARLRSLRAYYRDPAASMARRAVYRSRARRADERVSQ